MAVTRLLIVGLFLLSACGSGQTATTDSPSPTKASPIQARPTIDPAEIAFNAAQENCYFTPTSRLRSELGLPADAEEGEIARVYAREVNGGRAELRIVESSELGCGSGLNYKFGEDAPPPGAGPPPPFGGSN